MPRRGTRKIHAEAAAIPRRTDPTVLTSRAETLPGFAAALHRRSLVGVAADRTLLGEELLERLAPADLRMRLGQDPGGL